MEKIEVINERLVQYYGKTNNEPTWRVVFSEDQYEHRLTQFTKEGFELVNPKVELLPKYKQWIHNKFILERLMPVPDINKDDLVTKMSYEPIWVFEDDQANPLPVKWEAIQYIIKKIHETASRTVGVAYKDPESTLEESLEQKEIRLARLHQDLFGNETDVSDALRIKDAIVVPSKYSVN